MLQEETLKSDPQCYSIIWFKKTFSMFAYIFRLFQLSFWRENSISTLWLERRLRQCSRDNLVSSIKIGNMEFFFHKNIGFRSFTAPFISVATFSIFLYLDWQSSFFKMFNSLFIFVRTCRSLSLLYTLYLPFLFNRKTSCACS